MCERDCRTDYRNKAAAVFIGSRSTGTTTGTTVAKAELSYPVQAEQQQYSTIEQNPLRGNTGPSAIQATNNKSTDI